jgi:hypothetical protein
MHKWTDNIGRSDVFGVSSPHFRSLSGHAPVARSVQVACAADGAFRAGVSLEQVLETLRLQRRSERASGGRGPATGSATDPPALRALGSGFSAGTAGPTTEHAELKQLEASAADAPSGQAEGEGRLGDQQEDSARDGRRRSSAGKISTTHLAFDSDFPSPKSLQPLIGSEKEIPINIYGHVDVPGCRWPPWGRIPDSSVRTPLAGCSLTGSEKGNFRAHFD